MERLSESGRSGRSYFGEFSWSLFDVLAVVGWYYYCIIMVVCLELRGDGERGVPLTWLGTWARGGGS